MKLLTKELLRKLPPLGSQRDNPDPVAVVKFFFPWGSDSWYGVEFNNIDRFYGYVARDYPCMGEFLLSELTDAKVPWGLTIERDMYFRPTRVSELRKKHERY